ncbi:UNVERIFIED_CONTAM: hypothetical protein RKD43_006262 [Streptomyces graminofaciens]
MHRGVIKKLLRGLVPLTLAITPIIAPAPAQAAAPVLLPDALSALTVADESRTGYTRTAFKHWNAGADSTDGCNTRQEVLLAEAIEAPMVGSSCSIAGGKWLSYYDGQTVTVAGALDIDHMVPLAEAWDSGASAWTAAKREAYANDQGAATSLVAVTARTNRSKADQDPAEWLPPAADQYCRVDRHEAPLGSGCRQGRA